MANDKQHILTMKKYHNFVDRNAILCKAIRVCEPGNRGVSQEDENRLRSFGLGACLFKDVPVWLKKWASLICEYIEFEQSVHP